MSANGPSELTATAQKNDAARKAELLKEIQLTKLKISTLQREKSSQLYNKRGKFYNEFAELEGEEEKLVTELQIEKINIVQQLDRLRSMVNKFRTELQDMKPTPEFVEQLKVAMEEIEGLILNFKERQRQQYENLLKEENMLSQEVAACDKRVEAWLQQQSVVTARQPAQTQAPLNSARDLPEEVVALERYLSSNGGLTGGWDEYDHGTFLRYRLQYKGKRAFINDLASVLPTRTEDEIEEHEVWYSTYLALNESKKEAIRRWRERKEEEKDLNTEEEATNDQDEELKKRQEELEAKMETERRERRAMLSKWKVDREIQKAEEEEQLRRREAEKERKEKEERQRQAEVRERVAAFKQQKLQEEEEKRLVEEALERQEIEEKRKLLEENLPKLLQRDMREIQRKKAKQRAKEIELQEKEKRLERLRKQVEIRVDRDPTRVYQPTQGWKERQKDTSCDSARGPALQVQHRAVPTWRQGLMGGT